MAYPLGKPNPNGGRKKGAKSKLHKELAQEVAWTGQTPAQFLQQVMQDPAEGIDRRMTAAGMALAYVHYRKTDPTDDPRNFLPHIVVVQIIK